MIRMIINSLVEAAVIVVIIVILVNTWTQFLFTLEAYCLLGFLVFFEFAVFIHMYLQHRQHEEWSRARGGDVYKYDTASKSSK